MSLKTQAIQTALLGNWQEAILLNKNLVKQDPGDIDALNRLALAYMITGKSKEAKTAYQKVVNIDPLNSIALRNLKKLKDKHLTLSSTSYQINNAFLEEPGKTKVIELINIAQPKIVESLRGGQLLNLTIKRLKIFVQEDKQYIGVLPDDIAKRLIKFIKSGCQYEAFLKSANSHKVTVFIKETKKTTRLKDQPSFLSNSETSLLVKHTKIKSGKDKDEAEEESEAYLEE